MKLYHGSNIIVDHPEISKGKPFNDFGQGFYLSDDYEQAREMAERVVARAYSIPQPVHDYDIVYGPIADDDVVRQMRKYEFGAISIQELMQELKYPPKITFQYFFGSELALEKLRFLC